MEKKSQMLDLALSWQCEILYHFSQLPRCLPNNDIFNSLYTRRFLFESVYKKRALDLWWHIYFELSYVLTDINKIKKRSLFTIMETSKLDVSCSICRPGLNDLIWKHTRLQEQSRRIQFRLIIKIHHMKRDTTFFFFLFPASNQTKVSLLKAS